MSVRAVYFDLGGVILRTDDKAPRTQLAERFGLDYNGIEKVVFGNESGRRAGIGAISEADHWRNVARVLKRPEAEWELLREQFFAGDRLDGELLDFMRALRPGVKVGLISNAWDGMRAWIAGQKFDDVFDGMTISAELGITKPESGIYEYALNQLGVRPGEAIFIDDMPENVRGAQAVGMQAVLFRSTGAAIAEVGQLLASTA